MGYRIQTYEHILIMLSHIDYGGLLAVELSNRLPSVTRPFVDQCLSELLDRKLIRYSDEYTGPYRYRITHRGRRYLTLFADLQGSDKG